jgi:hypothetical protein
MRRLAPGVESQDLGDALMCVGGDALFYNPALTLAQLAAQSALQQFLGAMSTTIFANRKSGGWVRGCGLWGEVERMWVRRVPHLAVCSIQN